MTSPTEFYKKYGAKGTGECARLVNQNRKTIETWVRTRPEVADAIALWCALDEEQRIIVSKLNRR